MDNEIDPGTLPRNSTLVAADDPHFFRCDKAFIVLRFKSQLQPQKKIGIPFGLPMHNEAIITFNSQDMKKSLGIASVESKAVFHEEAFEDFINNAMPARIYMTDESDQFSSNYRNIDWCGAYTPFNGSVDILCRSKRKGELKRVSIPSNTLFLVICTKEYGGSYKVAWTCSMS